MSRIYSEIYAVRSRRHGVFFEEEVKNRDACNRRKRRSKRDGRGFSRCNVTGNHVRHMRRCHAALRKYRATLLPEIFLVFTTAYRP